jgi:tetratricopeptide (TPR) repeat protein
MKTKPLHIRLLYLFTPLFVSCLVSCASVEPVTTTSTTDNLAPRPEFPNIFSERPTMETLDGIHQLSPEQEQNFLTYYNDPANQLLGKHQRLANYLSENNFLYEYETYTASEALSLNRGNCMTLAVVTTALASLTDIQVAYQLIETSPVYRLNLEGSVANRGVHIRSLIFEPPVPGSDEAVTGIQVDFFPSENSSIAGNVSISEYVAIYYRNIAAQALSDEDYSSAYWHTLESMKYDPVNSDALNMMAVTYKRVGELDKAEEIYRYGIDYAEEKLTLMKNYYLLLVSQDRNEEATELNQRLLTMEDPSPIHWFNVAVNSYDSSDYNNAIRYYNRAIEIAPYLHEAYLGIALSYYQLGQYGRAERAFNRALNNVKPEDIGTRDLYQAKLNALRNVM